MRDQFGQRLRVMASQGDDTSCYGLRISIGQLSTSECDFSKILAGIRTVLARENLPSLANTHGDP